MRLQSDNMKPGSTSIAHRVFMAWRFPVNGFSGGMPRTLKFIAGEGKRSRTIANCARILVSRVTRGHNQHSEVRDITTHDGCGRLHECHSPLPGCNNTRCKSVHHAAVRHHGVWKVLSFLTARTCVRCLIRC